MPWDRSAWCTSHARIHSFSLGVGVVVTRQTAGRRRERPRARSPAPGTAQASSGEDAVPRARKATSIGTTRGGYDLGMVALLTISLIRAPVGWEARGDLRPRRQTGCELRQGRVSALAAGPGRARARARRPRAWNDRRRPDDGGRSVLAGRRGQAPTGTRRVPRDRQAARPVVHRRVGEPREGIRLALLALSLTWTAKTCRWAIRARRTA